MDVGKKIRTVWRKTQERTRHKIVLFVAAGFALGGILIGAFWVGPEHGGRGGAMAVALSFAYLFTQKDYSERVYTTIMKKSKRLDDIFDRWDKENEKSGVVRGLQHEIRALRKSMRAQEKGNREQNKFSAIAAVVGTVAWGFGDLMASALLRGFE